MDKLKAVREALKNPQLLPDLPAPPPRPKPEEKVLRVYAAKAKDGSWWTKDWGPEWGEPSSILHTPPGWVFLESGNTKLTKLACEGPHWIVLKPGSYRHLPQRKGVLVPEEALASAKARTEKSKPRRKGRS